MDELVTLWETAQLRYQQKVLFALWSVIAQTLIAFTIKANTRPGLIRFAALIPCFLVNIFYPLVFSYQEISSRMGTGFLFTWMINFKLLCLCMNRGPLIYSWTLPQFLVVLAAPVIPKQAVAHTFPSKRMASESTRLRSPAVLLTVFLLKATCMFGAVSACSDRKVPRLVRELLYTVIIYCSLGLQMDGPEALSNYFLGLPLAPHFRRPWLTTSIADFWSHRWNLAAGNMIRLTLYEPICEGRLVCEDGSVERHAASPVRRYLGLLASFAASGALHEMCFWFATGRLSGYWTAFFLLQVPLIALEKAGSSWLRAWGISVPPFVSRCTALLVLFTSAHLLFYPPLIKNIPRRS